MATPIQAYVAVVDPTSGVVQEYVTLVDSSGNLVYAANQQPQGRLTLTTAVPVLTTAVATAATVFYTPYAGNIVPCWNGTRFVPEVFSEVSNVLANSATGNAGPAAGAAAKNYDLFVWKSGTTIFLTRGGAWFSDTARSTATENDLQRINGVLCNLNAITNGPAAGYGTYVGTVRTDAGGATVTWTPGAAGAGGAQVANIGVWNTYNRRLVLPNVQDNTASWAYTTNTLRQSRADVGNQIQFVRGLNEDYVKATFSQRVAFVAALGSFVTTTLGLDSITAQSAAASNALVMDSAAQSFHDALVTSYSGLPGLGYHYIASLENGDGTNANVFRGSTGGAGGHMLSGDFWW